MPSSKERPRTSRQTSAWEEAGGEFYQEGFQSDSPLDGGRRSDVEALLPSRQPQNNDTTDETKVMEELEAVKGTPEPMNKRRIERNRIRSQTKHKTSALAHFTLEQRKLRARVVSQWKQFFHFFVPFRSSMRQIEAFFGTGMVSYFIFLRRLLYLNLAISLLLFLFIVLPHLVLEETSTKSTVGGGESTAGPLPRVEADRSCNGTNVTVEFCSECYDNLVQNSQENNSVLDKIQAGFLGTNAFELTPLFYGYYQRDPLSFPNLRWRYNVPLAYLLVTLVHIFISFVSIVRDAAKGFQDSLMTHKGNFNKYCSLFFAGWDFCIRKASAASIKKRAIYHEVKGLITSERLKEERRNRTTAKKFRLYSLRFVSNLISLCLLAAAGFAILKAASFSLSKSDTVEEGFKQLLYEYLPSIVIILLNLFVPYLFMFLLTFEDYSPLFEDKMTLLRMLLLRLASLGTLMWSFYDMVQCDAPVTNCAGDGEECKAPVCWETYVGQQIYRLTILDFLVALVTTICLPIPRKLLGRCFASNEKIRGIVVATFNLPKELLDLIYVQSLSWFGAFFSPVVPLLTLVKLFLLFYVKKFYLSHLCLPPSKVHQASRTNAFFMVILLVSFCVVTVPVGFVVSDIRPSLACGPFRGLDFMWQEVLKTIEKWPGLLKIAEFMNTSAFFIPLIIALCIALYYYYAVGRANKALVATLRRQLVVEGKDKQFLLGQLRTYNGARDASTASAQESTVSPRSRITTGVRSN
ncbi:unnamed protein product [Cyprideis torosa]|uniref:Uncharacterized protein n=1 Tax=Cyprideis torosa TaxID=163714 RepID=A0A7R8ZIQ3_9CRUS|nr:unnamed protein product [Cyprideis torosa]CAG0880488.1 unnamed protein product [Cyprideis torosa]